MKSKAEDSMLCQMIESESETEDYEGNLIGKKELNRTTI